MSNAKKYSKTLSNYDLVLILHSKRHQFQKRLRRPQIRLCGLHKRLRKHRRIQHLQHQIPSDRVAHQITCSHLLSANSKHGTTPTMPLQRGILLLGNYRRTSMRTQLVPLLNLLR